MHLASDRGLYTLCVLATVASTHKLARQAVEIAMSNESEVLYDISGTLNESLQLIAATVQEGNGDHQNVFRAATAILAARIGHGEGQTFQELDEMVKSAVYVAKNLVSEVWDKAPKQPRFTLQSNEAELAVAEQFEREAGPKSQAVDVEF